MTLEGVDCFFYFHGRFLLFLEGLIFLEGLDVVSGFFCGEPTVGVVFLVVLTGVMAELLIWDMTVLYDFMGRIALSCACVQPLQQWTPWPRTLCVISLPEIYVYICVISLPNRHVYQEKKICWTRSPRC